MRERDDERFMRAALRQAAKGVGKTSPNPAVGAVLVCGRDVIAKGYHRTAGTAHAEVDCLANLGKTVPPDATLYVTLEPCSTSGRTPPCTDTLIHSGIRRIVVGAVDPNPRHAGRGLEVLRNAGIEVRSDILAAECSALNKPFNKWIQTGQPYVIAKCGMSLDGRLTTPEGSSRWITSAASRRHANRRRAMVDAVMVGAETVRKDNPRLTLREGKHSRQPWRVVLSRSGSLPQTAHLFSDRYAERTLVFGDESLQSVLTKLGQREITSVLLEGGGQILAQALDYRLIDRLELYLGSIFTGGPVLAFGGNGAGSTAEALRLAELSYERIGSDIFVSGEVASFPTPEEQSCATSRRLFS
ncbi:MAG: bifunctional diaminohydroxyphosphoribosylaminopyrimidine deaminase/5-amino-6-(5-phosphoribosylamino)uracil reductase RibD [Chthoniobacterales bacterium]|nr:bifunctional diaminohydroxyphosphoribosylaminopyrimidine deaminase/5-amino-6-(5-phosphoribosylamino)uracil reductase RibD [Chthoniobacterales bacterium]